MNTIKCPRSFIDSERLLKRAICSRDISRIEKTIESLTPFDADTIAYLLQHISIEAVEQAPTNDRDSIHNTHVLSGSGPWKSTTNIDNCYHTLAMVSFLHKAQKDNAVQAFVRKCPSLHFVAHAAFDLQNFSVFSALKRLSICGYKGWNDCYLISGINGIPVSIEELNIYSGDLTDIDTWEAPKYTNLNIVQLSKIFLRDAHCFAKLPALKELCITGFQMKDQDLGDVQAFGPKLESLKILYLSLSGFDCNKMPNLKKIDFNGNLLDGFSCSNHSIEVLSLIPDLDMKHILLSDVPNLRELHYRGNTWRDEVKRCENFHISNAPKVEKIHIIGRLVKINIESCSGLETLIIDTQLTSVYPGICLKKIPNISTLQISSGGYGWGDPRKASRLFLDSAPYLKYLTCTNVDLHAKESSLPDLPALLNLSLDEGISTSLSLPNMPSLQHLHLDVPSLDCLENITQRHTKEFAPNKGLHFPALCSANLSGRFASLDGLDTPKLSTIVLKTLPELTNVDVLIDCPKLTQIEIIDAERISPRAPKKNMQKQEDVTEFLEKIKRSIARKNKKSKSKKSTPKSPTRSADWWISFIRKMIKETNHTSFAELKESIDSLPEAFWASIFEGMPVGNISDANWYSNRHFPYAYSSETVLLHNSWEPIKSSLRGVTYHFALYVYYYLLCNAPKNHAFAKQSFQNLTGFVMTIENGLDLFSLASFEALKTIKLGHRQCQYEQVPLSNVDLNAIEKANQLQTLHLIGLKFQGEKIVFPELNTVVISESEADNVEFLAKSLSLTSVSIEDSYIADFSGLPFESIKKLQISSSKPVIFPGALLKRCTVLEELNLTNVTISDFSFLHECTALKTLSLHHVQADEIPNLAKLTNLHWVVLNKSSGNLLSMFAQENHVQRLDLQELDEISLQMISQANALKELRINRCPQLDCSTLPTLPALGILSLEYQDSMKFVHPQPSLHSFHARDLFHFAGAEHLPGLQLLTLQDTTVPLGDLYGLFSLSNVNIEYKTEQEVDLSPVSSWPMLSNLKIRQISEISDLTPLTALFELHTLYLNPKVLGNIEVLTQLPKLKTLSITGRMIRTAKKYLPNVKVNNAY